MVACTMREPGRSSRRVRCHDPSPAGSRAEVSRRRPCARGRSGSRYRPLRPPAALVINHPGASRRLAPCTTVSRASAADRQCVRGGRRDLDAVRGAWPPDRHRSERILVGQHGRGSASGRARLARCRRNGAVQPISEFRGVAGEASARWPAASPAVVRRSMPRPLRTTTASRPPSPPARPACPAHPAVEWSVGAAR